VSVSYTNIDAESAGIEIYQPREDIGADTLELGQYALGLDGDPVVFIVGTIEELGAFTTQLVVAFEQAKAIALGPISIGDFTLDEDHDYVCPRCEACFVPAEYPDLRALIVAVREHITGHNAGLPPAPTIEDI
jgi:hypothetical protein